MKQRSANNNTFLCIKIPEIQLLVSYQATDKDKNIKDLKNVRLLFPLFEVHDKTWTWLDLINALKSHVKKALVSQAIKHKLIKVPIQPVNKLLSRVGRSNSQQHLTNLELEEHEKIAFLKLFGTKFIEKNSNNTNSSSSVVQNTNELDRRNSVSGVRDLYLENANSLISTDNKSLVVSSPDQPTQPVKTKKPLAKSNSTVSFNFRKHLLKFSKEKNESKESGSND